MSSGAKSELPTRTGFRGDVQGLRAIAVLAVIAGHAGVPFLPGGFVGVDVFFVISGFLISQVLLDEVASSGRISLRDFYARRARRILPAATLVLSVTVVASMVWLSAVDALRVVSDALWASVFAANVRFADVGADYFAAEQAPSPLQHYWSLAVEEQFYLAWPLLLLGLLWVARRRVAPQSGRGAALSPTRGTIVIGLVVVAACSLVYATLVTAADPVSAYFSTPARAWELAVGAALAGIARPLAGRLTLHARALLASSGLLAVALACARYDAGTSFPGPAALLPVLGTAAVLLAGSGGHPVESRATRALGVVPLRVVGDWSYSLYLWHWPLLVVPASALQRPLTTLETGAAVAATFVLAGLTYRFVETPLRHPQRVPRRKALALYPVSVLTVGLVCVAAGLQVDAQTRNVGDPITVAASGIRDLPGVEVSNDPAAALVQASVVAARDGHPIPATLRPDLLDLAESVPDLGACDYVDDQVRELCPRGLGDPAAPSIVVLGNSHGRMWIPAFEEIAERAGFTTYYLVKSNCTAADLLVGDIHRDNEPWVACSDFRDWAIEQIAEIGPALTVVSTSGPNAIIYTDDGRRLRQVDPDRSAVTQQGFESLFARLEPHTDRLVLLRDIPKSDDDPGACLTQGDADLAACLFTPIDLQEADSDASVAAARAADVEFIDPTPWVCWDDQCPVVIGDLVPYRDRGHLTEEYAAELADDLGRRLGLWRVGES